MFPEQIEHNIIEELFVERIVPHLGTAETAKAVQETEFIYKSLCNRQPVKESLGFLYQKFFSTYDYARQPASKQVILDCLQFLNSAVRNNPALT